MAQGNAHVCCFFSSYREMGVLCCWIAPCLDVLLLEVGDLVVVHKWREYIVRLCYLTCGFALLLHANFLPGVSRRIQRSYRWQISRQEFQKRHDQAASGSKDLKTKKCKMLALRPNCCLDKVLHHLKMQLYGSNMF
jgi:hypothetical protein